MVPTCKNVLQISAIDSFGSAFNGHSLSSGINSSSHYRSSMAVWKKTSDLGFVKEFRGKTTSILNKTSSHFSHLLSLDNIPSLGGYSLLKSQHFRNADLCHLHLIHLGMWFSPLEVPFLSRMRPTVWTIHDMWPLTGACNFSLECDKWLSGCKGYCPAPRTKGCLKHYTPRFLHFLKDFSFRTSNTRLVVASDWMLNQCLLSSWAKRKSITKIPFGISTDLYSPIHRQMARRHYGILDNELVISFRGVNASKDRFKGVSVLIDALSAISMKRSFTCIVIQDSSSFEYLSPKVRVIGVGNLTEPMDIARTLSASDVFVMPSYAESFGMMAIEAMSCGVPVIASDSGALPEHFNPPYDGLVFKSGNATELSDCILQLLDSETLRSDLSHNGREAVKKKYNLYDYINSHIALYNDVLQDG